MAARGTLCYASIDELSCCGQRQRGDFMLDVDRTLLRENLKLSFEQRARKHLRVLQMVEELRRAGKSCDTKVMAVDLAQVIPPLVRAKVDFTDRAAIEAFAVCFKCNRSADADSDQGSGRETKGSRSDC